MSSLSSSSWMVNGKIPSLDQLGFNVYVVFEASKNRASGTTIPEIKS